MALVVPAYAAVEFSAVDNGDGTVSVVIDTADVVRGLALKVTCSEGAELADLEPVEVNAAFNTFIDFAFTTEAGAPGTYEVGDGHPFALADEAGVAAAGATVFSISMGVLDEAGNQEGFVSEIGGEVLITFATGAGQVCFELDTLRGGVVGDEALATNLDDEGICVAVTEGVVCLGDFNGDGAITGADVPGLIATFNLTEGDPGYNPIGDFNGDGAVTGADIPGFIAVFNQVCP